MYEHDITLTVNGATEELTVESRTLLVHALRDRLDYTGPNVGCESGKCGACTVHLDGDAVKSCTLLAVQADGSDVTTVEGMAEGGADSDADALHPIQRAFHEEHGLQCGYCTPGMVMTAAQVLEEEPDPSREAIRASLKGNICRCTGYHNVVNAVESAADSLRNLDPSTAGGE
ncbi:carbon monoxide dehydrogenase [Halogeometricum pallidum JCM 14848]|uniref:Carbon monoxide dehydrogenase n=1 Tax=Halogeometricum pallidum JCM 14848 TaxID=1227487 RepID=M0DLT6_HALPD|nr:(2Fe-2S)-binding protein [Halogeometricum pallidum]ELZ35104.1 carbon monoxide dehydrogenase [Halogeometricum pallidum JCM 14848]